MGAAEVGDALDRLILDDAVAGGAADGPGTALVLDDRSGALTLGALERASGAQVLVRCADALAARRVGTLVDELPAAARDRVVLAGDETLAAFLERAADGPLDLVLGRLPKSLRALDAISRGVARAGAPHTRLVLGGAVKHMSRTFNDALAAGFAEVRGLRGRGKHRCLESVRPLADVDAHTPMRQATEHGTVVGLGGVFSSAKPDAGGAMLAAAVDTLVRATTGSSRPLRVLDLGCGNGSVSLAVARAAADAGAELALTAVDVDADATASARLTLAEVAGAAVLWDPHAGSLADGSQDLVLLNPPFHDGAGVDMSLAASLFDAAARVLDPAGTLLVVHNSHLRYRPELARRFEEVEQVARDRRFTVLSAARPRR